MKATEKQAIRNLIVKASKLNGVSFANIPNYVSKTSGEIANHIVNMGISIDNAKQTDLNRLLACSDKDINTIATATNIKVETVKLALNELIASAQKNLVSGEHNTNQSKGQKRAFIWVNKSIRIHWETKTIHIFAQAISKTVIVKGTYKAVNSSDKTLAKNAIKKHLDLRTDKFRDFIIDNIDAVTEASI